MTYTPNFNDPRVRSRCEKALNWLYDFRSDKPSRLSTRLIDKYLGSQRNDLSKWLRNQVLVVEDDHYNYLTGKCKTYVRNKAGIAELEALLGGSVTVPLKPVLQQQLDTGEIEYTEKSDRLFSPIQYIPKKVRKPLLSRQGYRYNYDIKCAAPTLIKQHAIKLGLSEETTALDAYISDRSSIRAKIARECNLTEEQVKKIINGLLNGARLSCSYESSIWHLVDCDRVKFNLLKENKEILSLKEDFKKCWRVIEGHYPREYLTDKNGNTRKKVFGSKRKSQVYRELEISVIKEIQRYMKKKKIKGVLIHDGWTCDTMIDPDEVRTLIKTKLGYVIDIDIEVCEYV